MVLQELVQHVEQVVLHQRLDHQLVQVMLEKTITGVTTDQDETQSQPARGALLCYLDGDLELVQRADVLHQHGDDELVGDALRDAQSRKFITSPGLKTFGWKLTEHVRPTFLSVNEDRTCVYMSDWSMTA